MCFSDMDSDVAIYNLTRVSNSRVLKGGRDSLKQRENCMVVNLTMERFAKIVITVLITIVLIGGS